MIPHLFYYQLVVPGLLWLYILLHAVWPSRGAVSPQRPADPEPITPQRQRSHKPRPFVGLTHKPPCALCEHEATHGTLFYGKRVPVELIVHGLACLAEGLGIRATARVFAVDPNMVLG